VLAKGVQGTADGSRAFERYRSATARKLGAKLADLGITKHNPRAGRKSPMCAALVQEPPPEN
jgi:hypothetical protein